MAICSGDCQDQGCKIISACERAYQASSPPCAELVDKNVNGLQQPNGPALLSDEREAAHKIIREAMDKAGIVDGFYGGVMLSGKDVSSFTVGIQNRSCYANVERYQRISGMMISLLFQLLRIAHEEQENNTGK